MVRRRVRESPISKGTNFSYIATLAQVGKSSTREERCPAPTLQDSLEHTQNGKSAENIVVDVSADILSWDVVTLRL